MFAFLLWVLELSAFIQTVQEYSSCLNKQKVLSERLPPSFIWFGGGGSRPTGSSESRSLPQLHTSTTPSCREICQKKKKNKKKSKKKRHELINAGKRFVPTETPFCQQKLHCHWRGWLGTISSPTLVSMGPQLH